LRKDERDTFHEVWFPFDDTRLTDRCVGLPLQHHPLSVFLTLSAGWSHSIRVALFRATAVHRILAFRGFPTQPAVSLLSETVLSCRYMWIVKAETNIREMYLDK
jgi:hypothetical protein